jgi:hypothetical protein
MDNNKLPKKPTNIYADNSNGENEFFENVNKVQSEICNSAKNDSLPTIPQSVYDSLPTLLKKGTDAFDIERERDFYLTGALTVLSGCLTNISGSYDGNEIFPNLFAINIAPPASGKGRMKFAETIVQPLQKELIKQYQDEVKKNKANKKTNPTGIVNNPIFQTLFIAGNSSSAAIIKQLQDNKGAGIIFETEADTLSKASEQDWGSFLNGLIRCSFQQETIRYQRATERVFIEIEKPKLAIAISGTPDQVRPIINSIQNGLFSRFIYYIFRGNIDLRKIGKDVNGKNLTTHFENLGTELCKFINSRKNDKYDFEFTESQFKSSYEFFNSHFATAKTFLGEDISSVIFRLGLILYKICMVLSAMREYDNKSDKNGVITCRDEDFKIGLRLIEVYMKHSFEVFLSLQKPRVKEELSLKEKFLAELPEGKFETKDVNKLTTIIGRSERTLLYWLEEFVKNGLVNKISQGHYEKIKK